MTSIETHINDVRERVRSAKSQPIGKPVLLAYDANGIQSFLSASNALPYLRGASESIKGFDRRNMERQGALFGGGGRGLFLVSAESAGRLGQDLVAEYGACTEGSLSIASAPFDGNSPTAEADSLRWLRARMAAAKDAAAPPTGPVRCTERCADCRVRPAQRTFARGPDSVRVCALCESVMRIGQKTARSEDEAGTALDSLSLTNRLAVLSADGNEMGRLFSSLSTLESQAVVSTVVSWIFERGRSSALSKCGMDARTYVAPVAGGDDIRIFFGPEYLLNLVPALAHEIENAASTAAQELGALGSETAHRVGQIGVGMGVVVGPSKFPASRLLETAHDLERSAKRICGDKGARSAVDVALLSSGTEAQDLEADSRPSRLRLSGGGQFPDWAEATRRAAKLMAVPSSQRATLRDSMQSVSRGDDSNPNETVAMSRPELQNLFRYQVARNKKWQDYVGPEWRTPAVDRQIPTTFELDLAHLVSSVEQAARKRARKSGEEGRA